MGTLPPIERFDSSSGARIYRIPVQAFEPLLAYCYVILDAGPPTLVDTGSGFGDSNAHLLAGIQALRDDFGEPLAVTDLQRILITHGHIDHFGGAAFMIEQSGGAAVGVHELDRRILVNYEERVIVATKDVSIYLARAGVSERLRDSLIDMYAFGKQHFSSVPVSINLGEHTPLDGMTFIHTPGHCPGQVCIRLGDVLLSADHVLSRTTPNQAPESITHYTGLGHYFESLHKVARLDGIRLALGGHEDPITDMYTRVIGIHASHQRKLERIIDIVRAAPQPPTISEISKAMYPDVHGYDILLALSEVGAHVEYLYERSHLAVHNLIEVEQAGNPALRYAVS
jgi:glyoxylase-like metal-dependent hydrolase (beta-lactamase superfamily II)